MRTKGQGHSNRLVETGLVILILAVAALLRLYDLDRTSLWYDEAVSWNQSKGSFGSLLTEVAKDNYPPLHNVLLWLTMPVLGDGETALRLPSAILGVLAVWLTYLAGTVLDERPTGLLAAALLAISPFHIWFSTEARMYALLAACGIAFLLSVLKVLQKPAGAWVVALGLSGAFFLYSHIYALLGFAAVGLACGLFAFTDLLKTGTLRKSNAFTVCLAMGASTIAFLPWLLILANRARAVAEDGFWIAYPDGLFLKSMIFNISGSLVLFWCLCGLAAIYLMRTLFMPWSVEQSWKARTAIICVAYTAGPALLAYLYSVAVQPILFDRYLIAAWPGLLLLASLGARCLLPRLAPAILFAAALLLTYPELKFTLIHKIRPEWREIATAFENQRQAGDDLSLYKGFAAPALSYYLRTPNSFAAFESLKDLEEDAQSELASGRWLLVVHSNSEETDAALQTFGVSQEDLVAQRFGWGASGLKLLKKHVPK